MPIIRKDEVRPQRPVVIVLYGVPGSGKTSIATTAETPVIIDTDRGSDRAAQVADTLIANSWNDISTATDELHAYRTIVVDTAKSMLDDFLSVYVCEQNYKLRTNSLKRFGEMASEFSAFVGKLQASGSDIIFICHDKETSEGDIIKHSPDCTGSSKDLLLRKADQVGYVSLINGHRTISFDPRDNFVGKNVAQIHDTEIPDASTPEFATFMATIIAKVKDSIRNKTEAQRKANELVAKLRAELDAVDDEKKADALLAECKELPTVMKKPFFMEINVALTGKGFAYDKETARFIKPETGKKEKKKNKDE